MVALVVTIIILIILATISIRAVFDEGGLIDQANKGKVEYRAAEVDEEVLAWKAEKKMAEYATGITPQKRDALIADQLKRGLLTQEEADIATETGEVQIGSRVITYGSNVKTLVELYEEGELKIGDYVNYQNPTNKTYTADASKTGMDEFSHSTIEDQTFTISESENQLNWRVLGIDKETGGLKLIAGSPMKRSEEDPYFLMYGAEAYLYGVDELNNIAALYKNDLATKARSITMDDIDEITGVTKDTIKDVDTTGTYGKPYSFPNHYTPEDFLKEPRVESTVSGTQDGYIYVVNYSGEEDVPSAKIEDTNVFNMLFENTEFEESDYVNDGNYGKPFWLASSSVIAGDDKAYFGLSWVGSMEGASGVTSEYLFFSNGKYLWNALAVRPVVILKSNVTEEQIQKIEDKTEERWVYQCGGSDAFFR